MRLPEPLPNKACGECTACCVHLAIDDPALKKPADVPCLHMILGSGCAIHPRHPETCRTWHCGWRFLQLSEAMRPDRAGILLVPEIGSEPGYQRGGLTIVLAGDDASALGKEELLNLIAKCTLGGVPIYLTCGTGTTAKKAVLNEIAKAAIVQGNKGELLQLLRKLHRDLAAAAA